MLCSLDPDRGVRLWRVMAMNESWDRHSRRRRCRYGCGRTRRRHHRRGRGPDRADGGEHRSVGRHQRHVGRRPVDAEQPADAHATGWATPARMPSPTWRRRSVMPVRPARPSARRPSSTVSRVFVTLAERLGVSSSAPRTTPTTTPTGPAAGSAAASRWSRSTPSGSATGGTTSRGQDGVPAPVKTDDVWLLSRAWSTPSGFVRGARFVFRVLGGLVRGRRPWAWAPR